MQIALPIFILKNNSNIKERITISTAMAIKISAVLLTTCSGMLYTGGFINHFNADPRDANHPPSTPGLK